MKGSAIAAKQTWAGRAGKGEPEKPVLWRM
jgi:hypothetical protein